MVVVRPASSCGFEPLANMNQHEEALSPPNDPFFSAKMTFLPASAGSMPAARPAMPVPMMRMSASWENETSADPTTCPAAASSAMAATGAASAALPATRQAPPPNLTRSLRVSSMMVPFLVRLA